MINSFNIDGVTKFTRPVFGDGRVYIGTTKGYFYGFGSPVTVPLNCSSPYTFPKTQVNSTSTPLKVTCNALIGTTVTSLALSGNKNFQLSNLPTLPLTLNAGQSFSFQAAFAPLSVGPLSSDVLANTTNSVAGYSINTPITLKGTANSGNPILSITPNTLSFNEIVGQQAGGVSQTSLWNNLGDNTLSITQVQFSTTSETGPWVTPNITGNGTYQVGPFTFSSVPSTIAGTSTASVNVNFNPTTAGNAVVYVSALSNGGSALLDVVAIGSTPPAALIQFESFDGSGNWITLDNSSTFTFGNVTENQTKNLRLRVTNNGGPNAAPLSITVSKPPYGVTGIVGAVNNVDLAEGTSIAANQSATATLYCSAPYKQVNTAGYSGSANWTMNTGDPNLGKQFMMFTCNAVAEQVGPLMSNGSARYPYLGCFRDSNPGRQLATLKYTDTTNNTNEECINACYNAGWIFAATEYQQEW